MNIIFVLNHPAHYHLFKYAIKGLQQKGHKCDILIRPKDVLQSLLDNDKVDYTVLNIPKRRDKNIIYASIMDLAKRNIKLAAKVLNKRPDIMVGTDWSIACVGRLLGIPSIVFNEDDTSATPENKIFYPLAKTLVLPDCCDKGLWNNKKISYEGYHELAYLHPGVFKYNPDLIKEHIDVNKEYIIIRLVKLTASHDKGKGGIDDTILEHIIRLANTRYQIYISSEGQLNKMFEKYRFKFNPILMHHFIAGASIIIGDSQTMIAEAAMLGVPSIRFNDFVRRLGYLEELEYKYGLTTGFNTNQIDKLLEKLKEIVNTNAMKHEWDIKKQKMLADKINVSEFIIWFLENYPDSYTIMKSNPNYQYKFR